MAGVAKAIGLVPSTPKVKAADPAKAKADELDRAKKDREKSVRAALEDGKAFNSFAGTFGQLTEGRRTFG